VLGVLQQFLHAGQPEPDSQSWQIATWIVAHRCVHVVRGNARVSDNKRIALATFVVRYLLHRSRPACLRGSQSISPGCLLSSSRIALLTTEWRHATPKDGNPGLDMGMSWATIACEYLDNSAPDRGTLTTMSDIADSPAGW
jgi:hypothetical protein